MPIDLLVLLLQNRHLLNLLSHFTINLLTFYSLYLVFFDVRDSMRYSEQIKPISYLKANAATVMTTLSESRSPMIITQNGEAKAVIQDIASYEQIQETMALLKILALGQQQVKAGEITPVKDVVQRLKNKRKFS